MLGPLPLPLVTPPLILVLPPLQVSSHPLLYLYRGEISTYKGSFYQSVTYQLKCLFLFLQLLLHGCPALSQKTYGGHEVKRSRGQGQGSIRLMTISHLWQRLDFGRQ